MLLKLYQSYWLMLPSEIREYILVFKISQGVIEQRKAELTVMLCKEIVERHQLKEAWGLGPIRCRILKCKQCTEDALGILGFRLLLFSLDALCGLVKAICLSETMETRESSQSSRAETKSTNQKEVFVQESGGGVARLL